MIYSFYLLIQDYSILISNSNIQAIHIRRIVYTIPSYTLTSYTMLGGTVIEGGLISRASLQLQFFRHGQR